MLYYMSLARMNHDHSQSTGGHDDGLGSLRSCKSTAQREDRTSTKILGAVYMKLWSQSSNMYV
jgi:hypothetical protein